MDGWLRLRIAFQTMKDAKKTTIIVTFLFMGMAAMYCGMFPAFKNVLEDMLKSGGADAFSFFPNASDMATYVGYKS